MNIKLTIYGNEFLHELTVQYVKTMRLMVSRINTYLDQIYSLGNRMVKRHNVALI